MNKVVKALIIAATAVFFMGIGTYATLVVKHSTQAVQQPQTHIYTPEELLAEANKLRAEKGVAPLKLDERLNASAQWKAEDMKQFNYFGHVRDGYHGYQKASELDSDCKYISENINSGNLSHNPFDAIHGWPTSKLHYEAIIDTKYDTTGFGIVQNGNDIYYVEHFCDL